MISFSHSLELISCALQVANSEHRVAIFSAALFLCNFHLSASCAILLFRDIYWMFLFRHGIHGFHGKNKENPRFPCIPCLKIIKRLSASPLCLWRFAENLPFHNLFEILGNLLPHIDYRAIDFMYLCRCDRIFVASLAELELHIVQSSGYIQAQFERNGVFRMEMW